MKRVVFNSADKQNNISKIKNKIDSLYEALLICRDAEEKADIRMFIEELEDELRFARAQDEADCN